ncbi:MAG: diguanylate cyclase [Deltaproteobacteria bacterium]|nr:diguanylate cyclase [Deltaproteobacteria bacterium]
MFTALLVAADLTMQRVVRDALGDAGCVHTDMKSLEEAALAEPDLVVVDFASTDLAAIERLALSTPDLPIVVLCDEADLDAVLLAGATECTLKPVRRCELVSRVRRALRTGAELQVRYERDRTKSERIVALQREKHDLERLVCVDSLTGIANRRHGLALLDAEWRRSSREQLPLGLVMIDLDCYHAYNEQYGHLGGDACLQRVADAMVRCLRRPSDYLGRYGGEEFIAVLPNTDASGARLVAERLRAAVEALGIPHVASACSRVVTITAGFASMHASPDSTVDKLIAVADAALLRAKTQGRNRVGGDAPLVRPNRLPAIAWERFAPVFADPWFADRIPVFLADAHTTVRHIIDALEANPRHAATLAHDLHVAARALDLVAIERLIGDLDRALSSPSSASACEAADELIQYITHVQVIYRRTTTEAAPLQIAMGSS